MPEWLNSEWWNSLIGNAEFQVLFSVLIAIVLGGLVGIEREQADKPAGFRTHMLVAGAAALLIGLGDVLAQRFTVESYSELLRIDPIRIVEAIITGVSFLGAGTIFRREEGQGVEGLTTAASLLFVAGIGIAVALERYILAVGVTAIVLAVLRLIRSISHRVG